MIHVVYAQEFEFSTSLDRFQQFGRKPALRIDCLPRAVLFEWFLRLWRRLDGGRRAIQQRRPIEFFIEPIQLARFNRLQKLIRKLAALGGRSLRGGLGWRRRGNWRRAAAGGAGLRRGFMASATAWPGGQRDAESDR
ncbi:MAG TPA: hypothetical protein VHV55_12820 [Pirellulales bacterium]|nr:hypothetical protein [Pirellulales bacterium]